MSLSTPDDIKTRYDLRPMGDLVADDGTAVGGTGLDTDTVLQQMLDDAYGQMVAALLVGGRYTELDLAALTDASLAHAKRIECDLAIRLLHDRRLYGKPTEALDRIYDRADKHLKALSSGEQIFSVAANISASVPQTTGPTTMQLQSLNLIRGRTKNYFPVTPNPFDR
jgi:hypothetical protein